MINDEIIFQLRNQLAFEPTAGQQEAMAVFADFLTSRHGQPTMILRGTAGSGKTSLAAAIVKSMTAMKRQVMLLAPTGRAAKVFAQTSGHAAWTIHRRIYREQSYQGLDGNFNLAANLWPGTLFIVDEASMISNEGRQGSAFGSGRLLDDLIHFIFSASGCRLLLLGDSAQLPPVGETESPALSADVLSQYGLQVFEADLTEVVRQGAHSGILYNASLIRSMIDSHAEGLAPRLRLRDFDDIKVVPGNELIEQLASSYTESGTDGTIVITRSNKRANIYNQGIRGRALDREEGLSRGDMVMIVKNNYFWTETERQRRKQQGEDASKVPPFLANGDRALVTALHNCREIYGFHFADASLAFPDYDGCEMEATVLLDTLGAEAPALTREQQEQLYQGVMADYADLTRKAERLGALRSDVYFNALQIKYAYAVTCHKAQGGQWQDVYVDQGYVTAEMMGADYYHWLYTALTRSDSRLFLVNWPDTCIGD